MNYKRSIAKKQAVTDMMETRDENGEMNRRNEWLIQ
jgi:hypothetical protein